MKPIGTKIAVVMNSRKEEEGGIVLPEKSRKTENIGTVTAIGEEVKDIKVGDKVYIESHLGTHFISKGVDHILIEESKIPCVIE